MAMPKIRSNIFETIDNITYIHCFNRKDELTGIALIDAEDAALCTPYTWYINQGYVCCHPTGQDIIKLQHLVLDHVPTKGIDVDHEDRCKLNNRKYNLRICNHGNNMGNLGKHIDNKSGYKGVFWDKQKGKWKAGIQQNYKPRHLGFFVEKRDAALAYNKAARELFGEFAYQNPVLMLRIK